MVRVTRYNNQKLAKPSGSSAFPITVVGEMACMYSRPMEWSDLIGRRHGMYSRPMEWSDLIGGGMTKQRVRLLQARRGAVERSDWPLRWLACTAREFWIPFYGAYRLL